MSENKVTMTDIERSRLDWMAGHLRDYLASGGAEGHIVDLRDIGGLRFTTTLLLQTVGRKTGTKRLTPLIYGNFGGEVVIVASKGGADVHPAWYFNLKDRQEASFQIGSQAFRGGLREPQGAERAAVWAYMAGIYPPYTDYQAATKREIPIVMLTVGDTAEIFSP